MKIRHVIAGVVGGLALWSVRPVPAQTPETFGPPTIDHLIRVEWKQAGITPAPPVDDARYLRRVTLDITGTLPTADAVTAFMNSKSQYKRYEVVNQLLESPQYTEHWTDYWYSILMGHTAIQKRVVDEAAFRDWLKSEFGKNTPYNQFVYDLLTASGQNGKGKTYQVMAAKALNQKKKIKNALALKRAEPVIAYDATAPKTTTEGGAAMRKDGDAATMQDGATATANAAKDPAMMMADTTEERKPDQPINGAVNWYMKYAGTPADLSGNASRIFLGVQIQCAQCHDHKTEKWKQDDFRRFTACFVRTRGTDLDRGQMGGFHRTVLADLNGAKGPRPRAINPKNVKAAAAAEYVAAVPAALDGTNFSDETNRREALAKWMTADNNPWFAQEIVNRMWAYFQGRGFVDPIDDFRTTNPAVMPDLLKKMSNDFIANKYDLKYLIRTICATQAYQLSCAPAKNNDTRNTLWASHRLKEMEPQTLMTAVIQATNMGPVLEKVAGKNPEALKAALDRQFTFLFDVDEEFEQKEFEGTIPQALMLLNGNLVNSGATPIPGTALAQVMAMPGDDDAKIESLYLRTLSRKPLPTELSYWREFVNKPREVTLTDGPPLPQIGAGRRRMIDQPVGLPKAAKQAGKGKRNNGFDPLARFSANRQMALATTPKQQAYEDVFWTLLNSSEFIFNH